MIVITGKYNNANVFTDKLDNGSRGLIQAFCDNPASENTIIKVMPDVHPSKSCVVGMTIRYKEEYPDKIIPAIIGPDIGCGVTTVRIKPKKKIDFNQLDKVIKSEIPYGTAIRQKDSFNFYDIDNFYCKKAFQVNKVMKSLGTLGGGNHFIEIDYSDTTNSFYLTVHTGSRSLGDKIFKYYQDIAYKSCNGEIPYHVAFLSDKDDIIHYSHDIFTATSFACANRSAIINTICEAMKFSNEDMNIDSAHNTIDYHDHCIRKGAISARERNKLVIPLNMRDGICIGYGRGNNKWNKSAPHGCGRALNRSEAKEQITLPMYKQSMERVYSSCINKSTIDESPMAYKNYKEILNSIFDTIIITDIAKSIYNFKAG